MLSYVQLFGTPWTVAHQAPLSMEFPGEAYWNAYSHSRGSSWPRDQIPASCITGRFFTISANILLYDCPTFCLAIYLLIDTWVMNRSATNIGVHITARVPAVSSFGYKPRSGISGSYGNSMFNFLKSHQTVFHNEYSTLNPHRVYMRVPFPYLLTTLRFSFYLCYRHHGRYEIMWFWYVFP